MLKKRIRVWRQFCAFVGGMALLNPFIRAEAQTASTETVVPVAPQRTTTSSTTTPVHLDLTSTERNLPAPNYVQSSPVNIVVGGSNVPVSSGSVLTPAERLATWQVFSTGQQSIQLGAQGNAIGGTFTMGSNFSQYVSGVVIPAGVTGVRDFGTTSALNLTGNLVNGGTLFAVSSNPQVTNATFAASNITNLQGGLLSSVAPTNLPGITSAISNVSLTLNALNNIMNAGTITSAANLNMSAVNNIVNTGTLSSVANLNINAINNVVNAGLVSSGANLNVTAGGSITNSLLAGMTGTIPVMQAVNNINLLVGSGSLVNSGLITSAGNINVASQILQNLQINNLHGTMQALNAINFGDPLTQAKIDLNVTGGDLISKQLNLFSGNGSVDVYVRDLQGVVNVKAGELHVSAETENLLLGNINLSGDPSFYNSAVNGDVTISGDLSFGGQDLAIVASRNIVTAPGAGVISTASTTGNAGNITMIAGAQFTASSSSGPPAPGQVSPTVADPNDPNITLTITGASASGGKIDLTNGGADNITSLSTTSTAGRGGHLTLAAFAGSSADSGTVTLPASVTLTTGGAGGSAANSNGDVVVIAGATSGTPINIGPINTLNTTSPAAATSTGFTNIVLAQPTLQNGTSMTITGGTVTAGALVGSVNLPTGTVSPGNLDVRTETGMTISSPGTIALGATTTNGGNLMVVSQQNIVSSATAGALNTDSATGKAGNLTLLAGANTSWTDQVTVRINQGSATGGFIDLNSGTAITSLSASTNVAGASAGNITVAAFAGSDPASGTIALPSSVTISSNGGDGGLNRNISIFARNSTAPTGIGIGGISLTNVNSRQGNNTANIIYVAGYDPSVPTVDVKGGNIASSAITRSGSANVNIVIGGAIVLDSVHPTLGTFNKILIGPEFSGPFDPPSTVFVNGSITLSGAELDTSTSPFAIYKGITIRASSASPFQIGSGATTHGVNGVISANGNALHPNAGNIKISNSGDIQILSPAALSASSGPGGGAGGVIELQTSQFSGNIILPASTFNPVDGSAGQRSGSLRLTGADLLVAGGGHAHVSITGTNPGNNLGVLTLNATNNDLDIGSGNGQISVAALGGGKTINLTSAGYLTIDPAAVLYDNPGFANNLNFSGSRVLVTGDLVLTGSSSSTSLNTITLSTNTLSAAFVIGPGNTSTNGVRGRIIAEGVGDSGGAIIVNAGVGTINLLDPSYISVAGSPGYLGGQVSLSAPFGTVNIGIVNGTMNGSGVLEGTLSVDSSGPNASFNHPTQISIAARNFNVIGGNLVLSANGSNGANAGSISVVASVPPNNFTIGEGTGQFQVSAMGGNGNVVLDTQGSLTVTPISGVLDVVDSNLALLMASLDYTSIDVGTGRLQITPNINTSITIGAATAGAGLNITAAQLANTTAGDLVIGNFYYTLFSTPLPGTSPLGVDPHLVNFGDIIIANDLDLSNYQNVSLFTAGGFNASGKTITLGPANFFVQESRTVNTGVITGTTGNITFHNYRLVGESPQINVTGAVTTGGTVTVYTGAFSTLTLAANIGGGVTDIGLGLTGTIQQTAGLITGGTVNLDGLRASFGTPANQINISATTLTAGPYGDAYINNVGGALSIGNSSPAGVFFVTSNGPITTTGPVSATQVVLQTAAGSNTGITVGGNISGKFAFGSSVTLLADGAGSIVQTSGVISGPTVKLITGGGSIGSSGTPIATAADALGINISTAFNGGAFVSNNRPVNVLNSQAGSDFVLTNTGNVTINHLATGHGQISITTSAGGITVVAGSVLNAIGGDLVLHATNLASGFITIGANASLNAASTAAGSGNLGLFVGPIPQLFGAPTPANITLNETNGGQALFTFTGITASAPNNTINADGKGVVLSSNGRPLTLGGGVTLSARPVSHYLNSLDLTDPEIISQVQALVAAGVIQGSITVSAGVVTGGNITIPQANLIGGIGLASINIPNAVVVNLNGSWQPSQPLVVNVGTCGTCSNQDIQIGGTLAFTGTVSTGVVVQVGVVDAPQAFVFRALVPSLDALTPSGNDPFLSPNVSFQQPQRNAQGAVPAPPSQAPTTGPITGFQCDGSRPEQGSSFGPAQSAQGPGNNLPQNPNVPLIPSMISGTGGSGGGGSGGGGSGGGSGGGGAPGGSTPGAGAPNPPSQSGPPIASLPPSTVKPTDLKLPAPGIPTDKLPKQTINPNPSEPSRIDPGHPTWDIYDPNNPWTDGHPELMDPYDVNNPFTHGDPHTAYSDPNNPYLPYSVDPSHPTWNIYDPTNPWTDGQPGQMSPYDVNNPFTHGDPHFAYNDPNNPYLPYKTDPNHPTWNIYDPTNPWTDGQPGLMDPFDVNNPFTHGDPHYAYNNPSDPNLTYKLPYQADPNHPTYNIYDPTNPWTEGHQQSKFVYDAKSGVWFDKQSGIPHAPAGSPQSDPQISNPNKTLVSTLADPIIGERTITNADGSHSWTDYNGNLVTVKTDGTRLVNGVVNNSYGITYGQSAAGAPPDGSNLGRGDYWQAGQDGRGLLRASVVENFSLVPPDAGWLATADKALGNLATAIGIDLPVLGAGAVGAGDFSKNAGVQVLGGVANAAQVLEGPGILRGLGAAGQISERMLDTGMVAPPFQPLFETIAGVGQVAEVADALHGLVPHRAHITTRQSVAGGAEGELSAGTNVSRNWGGNSGPDGQSWTTEPYSVQSRNGLGLETTNTAEFVSHGTVVDNSGITTRSAVPWGRFSGGQQETLIPTAKNQVRLNAVTMPDNPLPWSLPSDPTPWNFPTEPYGYLP